ncbi:unnamed protein product [Caretta caretta]
MPALAHARLLLLSTPEVAAFPGRCLGGACGGLWGKRHRGEPQIFPSRPSALAASSVPHRGPASAFPAGAAAAQGPLCGQAAIPAPPGSCQEERAGGVRPSSPSCSIPHCRGFRWVWEAAGDPALLPPDVPGLTRTGPPSTPRRPCPLHPPPGPGPGPGARRGSGQTRPCAPPRVTGAGIAQTLRSAVPGMQRRRREGGAAASPPGARSGASPEPAGAWPRSCPRGRRDAAAPREGL